MRVLSAIFLSALLLWGAYFYTRFADSVRRAPQQVVVDFDEARWSLEIERTFDCVPDPDYGIHESLVVQLKGVDVFRSDAEVKAAQPILVEPIEGIEMGDNDIFIAANLARLDDLEFDSERSHAVRLKLFRGREMVADQTHWASPGETSISETIFFSVEANSDKLPHNHDDHDH